MRDRFPSVGREWDSDRTGATCTYYTGEENPLEVVLTKCDSRPRKEWLQRTWRDRRDGRSVPVLLIATYEENGETQAVSCGPSGEEPDIIRGVNPDQLLRVGTVGLEKPSQIAARQFLGEAVEKLGDDLVGVRNQGLLATHELREGVPERDDWDTATDEAVPLLDKDGQALVEGLGYEIERGDGYEYVLKHGSSGRQQAVAVFIDDGDAFDQPSDQFGDTPVGYALNAAESHNLDYVVASDGDRLRLYTTDPSASFGSRGRTDTYVEVDTSLLSPGRAGYLWLLFSADALRDSGTLAEIQSDSEDYAADLSERLRERIYDDVVPDLAEAIAAARDVDDPDREQLDETYEMTLYLLYRLLFVAYAEDERHLPRYAEGYERRSLKETAKELHRISQEEGVDFDDSTTYWEDLQQLFAAIHDGQSAWGLPEYDGTLLSSDSEMSPAGARLAEIELTDEVFAPILYRLLVDETPEEGVKGPVDFRDIGVREFGVIYEGLLESELSQADRDLTLDDGQYVPADENTDEEDVVVKAGEVYLHGLSGERKATGTYYTKSTFVEHLLDHSLEPALEDHLAELDEMSDAEAAANFFDFRVVDVAMGSGHFLVGAVDRIEKAFSDYLAERQLAHVENELETLRTEAREKFAHTDAEPEIERDQVLRRQIARRCVYGVDLNPLATELARLSLWIHTFVPGLPLTFLDYNLRTGDALVGIGQMEEATKIGNIEQTSIEAFLTDEYDTMSEIKSAISKIGDRADASAQEVEEARETRKKIEDDLEQVDAAFDILTGSLLDDEIDTSVVSLDGTDLTTLRSYNKAEEALESFDQFHFPTSFPEIFAGEDPGFDVFLGNPPWDKVLFEEQQFWVTRKPGLNSYPKTKREEKIKEYREEYPRMAKEEKEEKSQRQKYQIYTKDAYDRQGRGHRELAKLFVERAHNLLSQDSQMGYVLPRQCLVLAGWKQLRRDILESGDTRIMQARNSGGWIFDEVEPRYMMVLISSSTNRNSSGNIFVWPAAKSKSDVNNRNTSDAISFTHSDLSNITDESRMVVPWLESKSSTDIFSRMESNPRISDDRGWFSGSHDSRWDFRGSGTHSDLVINSEDPDLWRIFMTRNVDAYGINHEKESRRYVDPDDLLSEESTIVRTDDGRVIVGEEHPAIAFRHVSRNNDTRTLIATALPESGYIFNSGYIHAVKHESGTSKEELLALVGYMNSFTGDWWVRRIVDRHVTAPSISNLPIPNWEEDEISEVASLVEEITVRDGIEVMAGGRRLESQEMYNDYPKEKLLTQIEEVVARGFGITDTEMKTILGDFSDKACDNSLEHSIVSAISSQYESAEDSSTEE